MPKANDTVLVLVDLQAKLLPAIHDRQDVVRNAIRLVHGARVLDLPIVYTEQNPAGLGPTVDELAALLDGKPITKRSFSSCGEPAFEETLRSLGRREVLLAGIESHVCVYQTARDLLAGGYRVEVVRDAVSSRTPANRAVGLERMAGLGASMTSVEMALFDLLERAEGQRFKEILAIVK